MEYKVVAVDGLTEIDYAEAAIKLTEEINRWVTQGWELHLQSPAPYEGTFDAVFLTFRRERF